MGKLSIVDDFALMRRAVCDIINKKRGFHSENSASNTVPSPYAKAFATKDINNMKYEKRVKNTRMKRVVKLMNRNIVQVPGGKVVAIASSTGGPKALQTVITRLPAGLNAPIVVVQHMPPGFTASLAERLNSLSELNVKEAEEGDVLTAGSVYIARGGKHLNIRFSGNRHVIYYTDEPNREGVKPCANYMYESLAECRYNEVICVVMTGMGADGTKGITYLKNELKNTHKEKKIHVIAQEEESCAVYGMPKNIVNAGLSNQIVTLERIAQEIITNVGVM